MEHYSTESFVRSSTHVRSPVSERRQRRLLRLAIACGMIVALGAVLLATAL